jgi:lysophospholipase L1-like esterase
MPNKINYTVQTANTNKSVEYWNPYTNQYQDTNPLIGIPAGSYSGLKARLKGSNPAIIATYPNSVTVVDATVSQRASWVVDGDSLDVGYLSSNPPLTGWAGQLYPTLDSSKFGEQKIVAVSGQTFQAMFDNQTYNKDHLDVSVNKLVIVTMGTGTNSLMYNVPVADLKAQIIQYIQVWRTWAAQKGVIIRIIMEGLTLNMKNYGIPLATYEERRQQLNADMFANYKSVFGADYFINWDADAAMRDGTNRTYFTDDGQHFTDEGQRIRSNIARPYLLAAQAGTALAPVATPTTGQPQLTAPGFSAASSGATSVRLRRTTIAGATSYVVQRSTSVDFSTALATLNMNSSEEVDDTGLATNTKYFYRLQAVGTGYKASEYATANVTTGTVVAPISSNISRLFLASTGVSTTSGTFSWADTAGSGDVLSSNSLSEISVLPTAINNQPAIRLNSTQLNGVVNSGITASQPFQILLVGRLPDTGATLGLFGMGNDVSGGDAGSIVDMLAYDSRLTIHGWGAGNINQGQAPFIPYGQYCIWGVRFNGATAKSLCIPRRSDISFDESEAKDITTALLPNTPFRLGQSHTPGLPFNTGVLECAAIIVQNLYDDAQWAQNIAYLKNKFALS